jgi:hypothetical protein
MPLLAGALVWLTTWLALATPAPIPVPVPDGGPADARPADASPEAAPRASGADAAASDGWSAVGGDGAEAAPAAGRTATPAAPPPATGAPPPAPATAPLRGTVFEKGTRHRLAGASVNVDAASAGETDDEGVFSADLAPGRHVLQIQLPGYEILQQAVDLGPRGAAPILRLLRRSDDRRYETVVSATPGQPPKITIGGDEVRTTPGSAGDPFRVIESLPGVAQVQWPLALYAIRGANPGNTGFFIDGIRVPALFHFLLGPSVIHPYLIDHLDFYPGGYPARYGGYVSGVVSAQITAPATDMAHASVDVRVYDVGGIVTSPWDGGRGTIAVAGRYSYTGAVASLFFSQVKFAYGDYQVRIEHPLAGGRATLLAFGSYDTLNVQDLGDIAGDADLQFHRVDLQWERALGRGRLRLRSTFGTDWARSDLSDSPITVRSYSGAPRLEYTSRLTSWADVAAGVNAELQRFRTVIPPMAGQPTFDDLARPRGAATVGAYLSLTFAWRRLEIAPEFRLAQYYEQGVSRFGPEPRLNARLRLGAGISLKGTVGQFTQMPSLPVGVPGFDGFDLQTLGLQRSTQVSLGSEADLSDAWQLDLTGFYQQLMVTDLRSTFSTDLRQMDYLEMRQGRGYGVEVLLRRRETHRLHGWLAYTLSRSERVFDGVWGPSDWDQRHILNLLASYRLGRGYSVGGRFHYNTGRPYPVAVSGNVGQIEQQRLPAFYQVDLRADKKMVFDRFTLTAYIELGNATATREVTGLTTIPASGGGGMSDGTVRQLGYRIILPTIGLHGEL